MGTTTVSEQLHIEYRRRAGEWSDIQGHLPRLYDEVARRVEPVVVELGVRWGTSTSALLAAVSASGGHLWSVDITPPRVPDWWAETGLWTLTIGNDVDPSVVERQPGEIDVLFVDTSHSYHHTLAELRTYALRVRPGGVVLLHDTELESPEDVGSNPPFPVARALDAFCSEAGLTWREHHGSYGLGQVDIPEVVADAS